MIDELLKAFRHVRTKPHAQEGHVAAPTNTILLCLGQIDCFRHYLSSLFKYRLSATLFHLIGHLSCLNDSLVILALSLDNTNRKVPTINCLVIRKKNIGFKTW